MLPKHSKTHWQPGYQFSTSFAVTSLNKGLSERYAQHRGYCAIGPIQFKFRVHADLDQPHVL